MKERAKNFSSEEATALMEGSLKDRGFIAERGFKKVISSFAEMLEKRGWQLLGEHREPGYASLVKEFFTNMVEKEGKSVTPQKYPRIFIIKIIIYSEYN